MGTAIAVAIISGLVSLASVIVNGIITTSNLRAERRRVADSDRRESEQRAADREANEVRDRDANRVSRAAARWEAAKTVIDAEILLSAGTMNGSDYRRLETMIAALSMLTHPDERNLRAALRLRSQMTSQGQTALVRSAWWYPWITSWASDPDTAVIFADNDEGNRAF